MILTKSSLKYFNIDAELDKIILSGKLDELLLIVPTNRKIRYLKKEIIAKTPGQAAGRLNLETIGTFASKLIFSNTGNAANLLSEGAAAILLKQSFQESELKYFANYKKEIPAGTLRKIKNVISEYKKHGITPARLREEADLLSGSDKIKAQDISLLFEKYAEKCRSLKVREIGDVYTDLNLFGADKFEKQFREIYPNVNLIIIMGFDEFTSPEIEIISASAGIKNSNLFLSFDYYKYNPLIFSHLDKCYKKLVKNGFSEIEDRAINPGSRFETDIKENLFKKKFEKKIEDYNKNITRISALTREKEIELIAKEIKELIINHNIEPHKISVAFNLIGKYSPFIRDIFSLYGIPFNLTDRFSLNTSPPVISIINFLEVLENDFYYKNIFRALNGSFIRLKGINLSNLLKASVNLKIISGFENWTSILSDAINKLDENNGEKESEFFEKEVYKKALADIKILSEILSPFENKMSLKEFKTNLQQLIFSLNIPAIMINPSQKNSAGLEENIKAMTTFINSINELLELFRLEYKDDEKFPLKFYLNNIRTAVSSTRYNVKEKPGYGVQITTMNEIRGLKFDYLFLSGLTDGDFPTRFAPEIFFSGSFAKSEQNHQTEERYLFYQSLCSWNKKLYLTQPLQEERKELSQSNFMNEFTSIFSVQDMDERNYSATLYAKEELLIEIGKSGVDKLACYPEALNIVSPQKIEKGIFVSDTRMLHPFGDSEFTGQIGNDVSIELLHELTEYKDRLFSITQLETFAKCPYKYFAERILGLQPVEEPNEEIEAIEMGSLLHEILYEFYKTIRGKRIDLKKAAGEDFNYAEKLIFDIAQEKINEAGFHSNLAFYEKEKVLGINGNRKNSLLYKFLIAEKEDDSGFIPELFEKSFGKMDEQNLPGIWESHIVAGIPSGKAGNVFVRGKIDRIEINPNEESFKVIDYKLGGKKPTLEEIHNAISLQLPLYMYAAKKLIEEELGKELTPAGAEIYSLKFSEKDFGKKNVKFSTKNNLSAEEKTKLNEEIIEICIKAINKYVEEIASGNFNLSKLKNREAVVCAYCNFKSICRIQEVN